MSSLHVFDPVLLYENEIVAASTTSNPSERLNTSMMSKVQVFVTNTGTSEDLTVTIYSANAKTGGISSEIQPMNLGAGTDEDPYSCDIILDFAAVPRYIFAVAKNNDTSKSAKVTISVDRWRE